ncbi:MAG: hypothetical protein JWP00_4643, partial [Chloroflexi bacterium]|nr:hypothetical protein [Chloroflexota bacterium]
MAGQTKNASTSILQRVLDRTPLRQAHLTGFRSAAAISPAQFVARYFDRNFGILQRWMGSGGSPIGANSISRSLVARYTSFNQSFGPVQRALRPQPGRRLRSRNQPQADYDSFDAEDSADFDYTPEPEYFNPLEPVYAQPEYEQARPAAMPWEGPLNQTPQPVARRLEFQPANLRYLTNPERQLEPDYRPDFSGAAPFQAFQPDEATNRRPSTSTAPSQPAAYTPPADFAAPANFEDNSGPFVGPETAPVSDYASPVQRVSLPGYQAADYIASPVSRPLVQPALSRAVQRTIDSTVERPGAANLGASPAAVTRRLALPNTVARYRALKQAADKVLLGEQSGWEPESAQYAEPAYANPEFNPAGIREAQSAGATLAEVQRIQAETRSLLETQQSTNSFALPVEAAGPAPSNRQSYEVLGLEAAPSPANLPAETGPAPVRTQATSQSQGLPASAATQPIEETPAVLARLPHEDGPVTGPVYRPGSESAPVTGPVYRPGSESASVTGPTYRPGLESAPVNFHAAAIRSRPFNRPETAPALFDSVIPASLLDSSFMPGDVSPEIQRSGSTSPITTTGWANKLATLHNNPGVISGAALARQTHEAEASTAWSPEGSARVYAVQRRVRRNENAASETQDRIFGLAENNSLVSEFQPQWLKAMAAEEAAPLLQPVTRSQAISPEVASTH